MNREERTVCFDKELGIEAYHFKGIMQKFPNHFHEHYVIGYIDLGKRKLLCGSKEYIIDAGDMVLFHPRENHTCEQIDEGTLDYRCLNIKPEIMRSKVLEITGEAFLPQFISPVASPGEQVLLLKELHGMIMEERSDFEKEEIFYFLIKQLLEHYAEPAISAKPGDNDKEILWVCDYIEKNFMKRISLDELASIANRNKYSLIRSFTKRRGITPYRYLETIRINQAKHLLEQGTEPIDAAMQTGFVDQSHFTNFFKGFIGLTPGQYKDIFKPEKE